MIAEPSGAHDGSYRWEAELNTATWSGQQDHQELNALLTLRQLALPWDPWIDTSIAFGNGLSFAFSEPLLERKFHPDTGTSKLLWHIAIELEFAVPKTTDWWTLLRVHHRSGILGTFSDVDRGSNVIAFGVRTPL